MLFVKVASKTLQQTAVVVIDTCPASQNVRAIIVEILLVYNGLKHHLPYW